LTLIEFKNILF